MSVVINCPISSTQEDLNIEMLFQDDLINYLKITNGIRGQIQRSQLSKQCLDEANVNYGDDRSNLTDAAGYGFRLSNLGTNVNEVENLILEFPNLFQGAINQVMALTGVAYDRQRYSINLLTTIEI